VIDAVKSTKKAREKEWTADSKKLEKAFKKLTSKKPKSSMMA
jgi:hypothetical protein